MMLLGIDIPRLRRLFTCPTRGFLTSRTWKVLHGNEKSYMGLFQDWYGGGKRWFGLALVKKPCPLTLYERILWSYLTFKSKYGGASQAQIHRDTRIEASKTIPSIRDRLIEMGLVVRDAGLLVVR